MQSHDSQAPGNASPNHVPVLYTEVLQSLAPQPGESVLDVTLGLAGHAQGFLTATGPDGRLIGLDADATNLAVATERLKPFGKRVTLHNRNFRDLEQLLPLEADIVLADLGVSSPHLDNPERGFTFRTTAPLDMRYDRNGGETAADFLRSSSEETIAEVLREFGEIPRSRALARALSIYFRSEANAGKAWTTADVVSCVEAIFTYKAPRVLPQVFQALRIAVNDELGALQSLLHLLPRILRPGGRCGIISYHSLEDRMVKHTFRSLSTPVLDQRTGQIAEAAPWELLTRKAVGPSAGELAANPRSRSARFRAIRRTRP